MIRREAWSLKSIDHTQSRVTEQQGFTGRLQLEVGVQSFLRVGSVEVGRIDQEISVRLDDETIAAKWRFPAVFIQPNSHLLVFASDLNRTNAEEALHTNFKLKPSGETLLLSDAALRPLDRFQIPALAPDQSVGRVPDGSVDLQFYPKANISPASENLLIPSGPVLLAPSFTPEGGFFNGPVTVQITGAESNHVIRYTLDGSSPTMQSPVLSSNLTLTKSTAIRGRFCDLAH